MVISLQIRFLLAATVFAVLSCVLPAGCALRSSSEARVPNVGREKSVDEYLASRQAPSSDAAPGEEARAVEDPPEPSAGYELRSTARKVLRPVIWIAGISAVLSVLLAKWLPFGKAATGGAVAAFAAGLGLQYAVTRYGVLFAELAVWGAFGLTAAAAVPWVVAFLRRNAAAAAARVQAEEAAAKVATGVRLATEGHPDAGVAFLADALPRINAERKALLSRLIDATDAGSLDAYAARAKAILAEAGVPAGVLEGLVR